MSRRNFFVFTKISYLQRFRDIMGGQGKALHQRTNEQTMNEQTNDDDDFDELHGRS